MFCEEPRPAYDRVNLSKLFDGGDGADARAGLARRVRGRASGWSSATGRLDRSAGEARSDPRRAGLATTRSSWRPARPRSCRPSRGATRPAASSTAPSRISRRSAPGPPPAASGAPSSAAACSASRRRTRCATSASRRTWSSSRRASCRCRSTRWAARSCAGASRRSASASTPGHRPSASRRPTDDGRAAGARSSPTAASCRPTWSCSRPASGPATSSRAPRGLDGAASAAASSSTSTAARSRSRHLRHRRVRLRGRAHLRPGRARLPDGGDRGRRASPAATREQLGHFDMSTKLKLLGVDVASFGDAFGLEAGAHTLSLVDSVRASTRSWSCAPTRSACSAASWSATPRRTAQLARHGAEPGDAAARSPRTDPPAAATARAARASGSDALPADGHHLQLQQRRQGRRSARPSPAGPHAVGALKALHQGRHRLRLVRAARRRSPQGRADGARASPSTTTCASTSPTRARSCSTWSGCTRSRPSTTLLAQLRPRARAARSASPRWRRSSRRSGTSPSSTASTWRCRTPTTASWPTSSATARTRSCRASRAARSRRDQLIALGRGRQALRPLHQDHRRPARRSVRRARRAAAAHLARADRRRVRVGPRLRQGAAHGEVVRGQHLVPLRRAGLGGLAIRIENRYKGLRSPHKLKSAVSGCARECAEAQGKDFGIIATEKGYNLYVCGNGGMKPQHAQLLATDLDEETLVRYVDRFLMFYVRTADRLRAHGDLVQQARGRHRLPARGHRRRPLGHRRRARGEMQHVVDTYQCEWKDDGRGSRDAGAVPHLRQQPTPRPERRVRPRARPAPPGAPAREARAARPAGGPGAAGRDNGRENRGMSLAPRWSRRPTVSASTSTGATSARSPTSGRLRRGGAGRRPADRAGASGRGRDRLRDLELRSVQRRLRDRARHRRRPRRAAQDRVADLQAELRSRDRRLPRRPVGSPARLSGARARRSGRGGGPPRDDRGPAIQRRRDEALDRRVEPRRRRLLGASGKRVARRNLIWSILAEHVGFSVWLIWSVVATRLPKVGLPLHDGAALLAGRDPRPRRRAHALPVHVRRAEVRRPQLDDRERVAAAHPDDAARAPRDAARRRRSGSWRVVAATAGLGGGNFASSMANISFFYPDREKGFALGLNAAGGNIGVSTVQLLIPLTLDVARCGRSASARRSGPGTSICRTRACSGCRSSRSRPSAPRCS